mmetsp:Transcript_27375/g.50282  ORF Transcript_27375/g.50282 Transcript_27375/m.50282 type:complete len:415 (+) Transcript_27375:288-1532(+)
MHAAFRFQPAIGIGAADFIGGRFDARLFAGTLRLQLDLIALFLGPTDIHPRQHRGPVAGLGATGARVDLKKGIIAIGLTVQQRFQFFLCSRFRKGLERLFGVRHDFFVLFHLAQFDQLDIVGHLLLDAVMGLHRVDQHLAIAHQLLRGLWIIPQVGVLDAGVEFFQPVRRRFHVKTLRQKGDGLFDLGHKVLNFGAHCASFVVQTPEIAQGKHRHKIRCLRKKGRRVGRRCVAPKGGCVIARHSSSVKTTGTERAKVRLGSDHRLLAGRGRDLTGRAARLFKEWQVRAHSKATIEGQPEHRLFAVPEIFRNHICARGAVAQPRARETINLDEPAPLGHVKGTAAIFADRFFHERGKDRATHPPSGRTTPQAARLVIADIAARRDIAGKTHKPDILGVVGRPRLARDRHRQIDGF